MQQKMEIGIIQHNYQYRKTADFCYSELLIKVLMYRCELEK